MAEAVRTTPFLGKTLAVLADCHIHPGGGPQFPDIVLNALEGVDLIVTLGDMGDVSALDQLDAIVTDRAPDGDVADALAEAGVDVVEGGKP